MKQTRSLLLTLALSTSVTLWAQVPFDMPEVATPVIPDYSVQLTDFGAIGDGGTLCTEAFGAAMKALEAKGGGHLNVPSGIWLTGPGTFADALLAVKELVYEKREFSLADLGRIMAAMRVGQTVDFATADIRAYELLRKAGADVLLHAAVIGPTMDGVRVTGVEALCAEGKRVFPARVVIDATGDGLVAAAAGVPYEMGRVGDGLVQPMSIMFTVGGIEKGRRARCYSEEAAREWKIGSRTWEEVDATYDQH